MLVARNHLWWLARQGTPGKAVEAGALGALRGAAGVLWASGGGVEGGGQGKRLPGSPTEISSSGRVRSPLGTNSGWETRPQRG